ncbi:MAG: DUF1858 domain-containing protein [Tannerella sp.]|jgi:hypothetical protein|nr:DUF1858 domain-containing protein [Tannerella sp.]
MEINLQTKIGAMLEAYPGLEAVLLHISPHFAKLKNPVLRRTVAKVATLQQAAQMAGIEPGVMVQMMRNAAGLSEIASETTDGQEIATSRPSWLDESNIAVRYDANPVIDSGGSPMQEIIKLANTLKDNEIMELTTSFKPAPIIDLLQSKGFESWHHEGKTYFIKFKAVKI